MRHRLWAFVALFALVATIAGTAIANQGQPVRRDKDLFDKAQVGTAFKHEGPHLPQSKKNMKIVGKLKLTDINDGITDVGYLNGHAYVGAWHPNCPNGAGTHIVDVSNPKKPEKVGFAATGAGAYVSEGVHVFHAETASFTGDILVQDRETCPDQTEGHGGFDLYDVTDPANPVALVMGAGDTDDNDPTTPEPSLPFPNDYHSAMGWQQGENAYVVGVDNFETLDVDIFDVTDPTAPQLIVETGLADWPAATVDGYGDEAFHHDMWVEKIGDSYFMLVSYWDVGYVVLDITDPANPVFVEDSDITGTDPIFPNFSPPEGNAHQAEWSTDRKFILAADEDFSPNRAIFNITSGPDAAEYQAGEFGWTIPVDVNFTDQAMNGPTVWGGQGCPGDPVPSSPSELGIALDPDEEAILVLSRGTCFFSEKVEFAQNAGYNAVLVGNHHIGAQGGATPDAFLCGSQGHEFTITASGGCIGHRAMHLIFGDTPEYDETVPAGGDMPPIDTLGEEVNLETVFDGWGYMHLIDADTLERIDSYAVKESKKQKFADEGVFPLSIHELESDPRKKVHLAYSAYYQAGARVLRFGQGGIREVGHLIPKGGADFWGVQPIPRGKKAPLLLFSDRHYGLYVMKYTGG